LQNIFVVCVEVRPELLSTGMQVATSFQLCFWEVGGERAAGEVWEAGGEGRVLVVAYRSRGKSCKGFL
jgi:hypothetical protein